MATLIATLGLDSTQYNNSFDGATQKVSQWAQAFGLILSAGTIAQFTREAIRMAESVEVMALKTGLSTDAVQRLGFVVDQNKGSLQDMERALVQLGVRAERNTADFTKWQIAVTNANGTAKTTEQLFLDVADRIRQASTQTERLAIATDTMGRAGTELIPVLQLGSAEMLRVAEGASIMRAESIKAITDMNDALSSMKLETLVTIGNIFGSLKDGDMGTAGLELLGVADRVVTVLGQGFTLAVGVLTTGMAQAAAWFANGIIEGVTRAIEIIPGMGSLIRGGSDAAQASVQSGVDATAQAFSDWMGSVGQGFGVTDMLRADRGDGVIDPRIRDGEPRQLGLSPTDILRIEKEAFTFWAEREKQTGSPSAAQTPTQQTRLAQSLAQTQPTSREMLRAAATEAVVTATRDELWQMNMAANELGNDAWQLRLAAMRAPDWATQQSLNAQANAIYSQQTVAMQAFTSAQTQAMNPQAIAQAQAMAQQSFAPGQQLQTGAVAAGGTGNLNADISTLVGLAQRRNALLDGRYKAQ